MTQEDKKLDDLKEAKQDPKGGKKPTDCATWFSHRAGAMEPQGPSNKD